MRKHSKSLSSEEYSAIRRSRRPLTPQELKTPSFATLKERMRTALARIRRDTEINLPLAAEATGKEMLNNPEVLQQQYPLYGVLYLASEKKAEELRKAILEHISNPGEKTFAISLTEEEFRKAASALEALSPGTSANGLGM